MKLVHDFDILGAFFLTRAAFYAFGDVLALISLERIASFRMVECVEHHPVVIKLEKRRDRDPLRAGQAVFTAGTGDGNRALIRLFDLFKQTPFLISHYAGLHILTRKDTDIVFELLMVVTPLNMEVTSGKSYR